MNSLNILLHLYGVLQKHAVSNPSCTRRVAGKYKINEPKWRIICLKPQIQEL